MGKRATAGTRLASLIAMAKPLCQQAERDFPRTGPGRKPEIADWQMLLLIMVVVLKKKKTKSSQFRFLREHFQELSPHLEMTRLPARSTYFSRYRRAWRLLEKLVTLQGWKTLQEGVAIARVVAVDKSMIAAKGPLWHKSDRVRKRIPKGLRGVDKESGWGCSQHDGWVQGYSIEVVVAATAGGTVLPLIASADTASARESQTCIKKVADLPEETQHVLADSGYDSNDLADKVERDAKGKRTGRRFLCPENRRGKKNGSEPAVPRDARHARRIARRKYYQSRRGGRLYARRRQTVEPFNEWFKSLFELEHKVWHRGLDNNRTQLLAAMCCYQLLARYNYRKGSKNGRLRWILDAL